MHYHTFKFTNIAALGLIDKPKFNNREFGMEVELNPDNACSALCNRITLVCQPSPGPSFKPSIYVKHDCPDCNGLQ